jgi:hypothetical protein
MFRHTACLLKRIGTTGIEIDSYEVRKRFFLKKEAKTFAHGVRAECNAYPKDQKFFGSFFQKRTACLRLMSSHPQCQLVTESRQRRLE